MKFISLFTKIPSYKRFQYNPRFYSQQEEEMKEREKRIKFDLQKEGDSKTQDTFTTSHRVLVTGAFQVARRKASRQTDPSASLIRLIILMFLVLLLISYLQFGPLALYGSVILVPFYFFLKLRKFKRKRDN